MPDTALQEHAFNAIRERIVFCTYAPGQKLSVKQLESELGIGRTPIRESLIMLSQQGLIYTVPQSGTYVSKIDLHEAENARYIREHLEQSVVLECCAQIDQQGKDALIAIIKLQNEAIERRDSRSFFALDNQFHEELFTIAGRHDIWNWIAASNTNLQRFRWLRTQVAELDWNTIARQHLMLFDSICAHDVEEAHFLSGIHLHLMVTEQDAVTAAFPEYFK